MAWSEERLLRWLVTRRRSGSALVGSRGHDAAVVRRPAGRPVLCVDQTIEGVHYEKGTKVRLIGAKAVSRALSDLAATAARPVGVLLAIGASRRTREAWLRALIEEAEACARAHGAELLGGDLAAAEGPCRIGVTAYGVLVRGGTPPGRDRARPGQLVLATGAFGGSALGRHLTFQPRLAEGEWLFAHGATALMDVSDGLSLDAERLARLSGVRVDLEHVPVHADAVAASRRSGRTALEHALADGEDHELLATIAPAKWKRCASEARRRFPGLEVIGRVRRGKGLYVAAKPEGEPERVEGGGWVHGG